MYFIPELWRIIKDYQIEYKKHHSKKLLHCCNELMKHRPLYEIKIKAIELTTISDCIGNLNPLRNFALRNQIYKTIDNKYLNLHSIEILPRNNEMLLSNIFLYYGWYRNNKDNLSNQFY